MFERKDQDRIRYNRISGSAGRTPVKQRPPNLCFAGLLSPRPGPQPTLSTSRPGFRSAAQSLHSRF